MALKRYFALVAATLAGTAMSPAQAVSYVQIGFSATVEYDQYDMYTGLPYGHFQNIITGLVTFDAEEGPDHVFSTPLPGYLSYSNTGLSLTAFDAGPLLALSAQFTPAPQPLVKYGKVDLAVLDSSFTSYIDLDRYGPTPVPGKLTALFKRESDILFDEGLGVNVAISTRRLAVPEASSWIMLICGFGLLGTALRRRHRQPRTARNWRAR